MKKSSVIGAFQKMELSSIGPDDEQKRNDGQRQNLEHLDLSNSDTSKAALIELFNRDKFKGYTSISLPNTNSLSNQN